MMPGWVNTPPTIVGVVAGVLTYPVRIEGPEAPEASAAGVAGQARHVS